MSKNYIVINGKKANLTEDLLKALGIAVSQNNPFGRVSFEESYYYIEQRDNVVLSYIEKHDDTDDGQYNSVNYFNDRKVAEQVALHQLLYRKLLKFAYDSGCVDTAKWNGVNLHWCIYYDNNSNTFGTKCYTVIQHSNIYFSTRECAGHAIKEVVEPFVKEHPEFVW